MGRVSFEWRDCVDLKWSGCYFVGKRAGCVCCFLLGWGAVSGWLREFWGKVLKKFGKFWARIV